MTISSQTRTAGPFTGTGAIVPYPFAFKVFTTSDVLATVTDSAGNVTTWTLGGNYTVMLSADQNSAPGGTLTPLIALPIGSSLSLTTNISVTQSASLTNSGGFFPKTIEDALDRLTILLQQAFTAIGGSVRVPESTGLPVLPPAATRAGYLLGFDGSGAIALIASAAQSASALALALLGSTGSTLISFLQAGAGAVLRTVQDKLRERVDLADFAGADPTGATSSSAALLAALTTGKAVYCGDSSRIWRFDTPVAYSGPVYIFGKGATFKSDGTILHVTDGTGSRMHGIKIMPVTTPWTIKRTTGGNTAQWTNVLADIKQSTEGYKPTSQDIDIWPTFSGTANEITNRSINPLVIFDVSSAAGGSDVRVESITGRQVNIVIQGYVDSGVRRSNFGAGGKTYGGVVFMNNVGRNFDSALLGYTLPKGTGNYFDDNKVKFASLCGATWFGNSEGSMVRNQSSFNGESGLKLYQYDGAAGPSETTACINTDMKVHGNTSTDNYYDGLDVSLRADTTYAYGGNSIKNNLVRRNRHTGITCTASNCEVMGNISGSNGTHGISVIGTGNKVDANLTRNNQTTGTVLVAQVFELVAQGDSNTVTNNHVANPSPASTYNLLHSGLLGAAPTAGLEGINSGNYSEQGPSTITMSSTIPTSSTPIFTTTPIKTSAYFQESGVVSIVAAAYVVSATDTDISFFTTATCTVTLPAPASNIGRKLRFKNTAAFAINSASANVGPQAGGAPGTAILAAAAGKWCVMKVDAGGTIWSIMSSN
jgi:hypothetical protein